MTKGTWSLAGFGMVAMMSPTLAQEAVNVQEWGGASNILRRAAQLIEERGWQQGAETPVAQECAATALERAFKEGDYSIVDFNYAFAALMLVLKQQAEAAASGKAPDTPSGEFQLAMDPTNSAVAMNWSEVTVDKFASVEGEPAIPLPLSCLRQLSRLSGCALDSGDNLLLGLSRRVVPIHQRCAPISQARAETVVLDCFSSRAAAPSPSPAAGWTGPPITHPS